MILSVITTVYNQAPFVAQMIESVLSQMVDFEYEFIIADDASTDGSVGIIEEYAKRYKHITFVANTTNLGPIKNYAQCLKLAKGKYIADIGGDDYWINHNKLQLQVDYLESHPEVGMVYTQYDTIETESGKIVHNAVSTPMLKSGRLFDDIITFNVDINVCSSCFRRGLIEHLIPRFENEEFPFEDTPMWLTIAKTHEIHAMPISTLCYRINKESLSHSTSVDKQVKYTESIASIRQEFMPKKYPQELFQKFEDEINSRLMVIHLRNKEKRQLYYKKLHSKGKIMRVLNWFPFPFVLRMHKVFKAVF